MTLVPWMFARTRHPFPAAFTSWLTMRAPEIFPIRPAVTTTFTNCVPAAGAAASAPLIHEGLLFPMTVPHGHPQGAPLQVNSKYLDLPPLGSPVGRHVGHARHRQVGQVERVPRVQTQAIAPGIVEADQRNPVRHDVQHLQRLREDERLLLQPRHKDLPLIAGRAPHQVDRRPGIRHLTPLRAESRSTKWSSRSTTWCQPRSTAAATPCPAARSGPQRYLRRPASPRWPK